MSETANNNVSFSVNAQNDIYLGSDGNLVMANGEFAVMQDCQHAMQTQLGEMVLSQTQGLPNLTDVWLKKNFIKWEAAARKTIMSVPGVILIKAFSMQISADQLRYSTQIQTVYSPLLSIIDNISISG